MLKIIKLSVVSLMFLLFTANTNAASLTNATCSVQVDYLLNNLAVESYQKSFVVKSGVGFEDDFSTALRQKLFSASTILDAGKTVIGIRYINDVGVQDAIDFNTKLTMHRDGIIESTSGSYTFTTTAGNIPQREHTINYTLACKLIKN